MKVSSVDFSQCLGELCISEEMKYQQFNEEDLMSVHLYTRIECGLVLGKDIPAPLKSAQMCHL